MKPSQLREWMRKYGNLGVLGAGGYVGLRHLWTQRRGPTLAFALAILVAGGIWCLRPSHKPMKPMVVVTLPPPLPVATLVPPPLRPQWQPRSPQERHRLDLAEGPIFHYIPTPPQSSQEDDEGTEDSAMVREKAEEEAEEAVESSLKAEVSGRAYADQGEIQLRKHDYDGAAGYFTQAFQIAPQVVVVQIGLERSWHGQRIAQRIQPLLPPDQKIQRLLPFPVPGHTLWAVLSCDGRKAEDGYSPHEKAQCSVFEEHPGLHLTRIWKSKVISSDDDRPLVEPDLWAWPMTGHKIPELVFFSGFSCGSWNPSTMHLYQWRKGTLQQILDTESACSHWIAKAPHTRVYQVRSLDLIGGMEMGHGALVPWPQIYDWNGRRYVAADAKHPEEFQKAQRNILAKLKRFPDDPELWKYLGYAYLYNHQRRSAFAAFHKAEHSYRTLLQDVDEREYAEQGLRELAEMRGERR